MNRLEKTRSFLKKKFDVLRQLELREVSITMILGAIPIPVLRFKRIASQVQDPLPSDPHSHAAKQDLAKVSTFAIALIAAAAAAALIGFLVAWLLFRSNRTTAKSVN